MMGLSVSPYIQYTQIAVWAYLSGETLGNVDLFSTFAWYRRFASRTNCPTHAAKLYNKCSISFTNCVFWAPRSTYAPRNELKGNVVTSKQYAKHAIPENIVNAMKLSMSLSRAGVSLLYVCHDCAMTLDADCEALARDTLDEAGVAPAGLRGTLFGAIATVSQICLLLVAVVMSVFSHEPRKKRRERLS